MSSSVSKPDAAIAPAASSPRRTVLPLIRRLHFYAGVFVAPFILIAAITGSLYAMAPTIERFVYRDLLSVEPAGESLPLSAQAAAAQARVPDLTMTGLRPAPGSRDSTRVTFADPGLGADTERAVFVDPHTGRALGQEQVWFGYLPLSTWLDGLHRHLQLGEPGRLYSELAASWLWVVALGGVALWLVKVRGDRRRGRQGRLMRIDGTTEGRARTRNWHGAVGVWILPMLLFLSATGITWSTYAGATVTALRAEFNWQRPQLDTALTVPSTSVGPVDLDGVVLAAGGAGVAAPVEITLPVAADGAVGVAEIDEPYRLTTNAAAVDPASLRVTGVLDYDRDYSVMAELADWGIRMHMGLLFGWLNQLLLLGVAVALVTVIVRGYRMWWQRRPTRGSDWAVGRPPVRGGIRRLHPAVLVVGAVITVAVGWFLPLLGISLAGFLLVDLVVGRVAAYRTRAHTTQAQG
ncbi:PepSY domain-containing protein [Mycobacterium sp. AZCC_0083]|uniref:PepSY-associated TM helix domain-containing protein n=1 Tax=Mycobacterium sp. AZCC_0083 TaxID=2735882 RepID=UPI00161307DF|nr:PepSY-associated TM helix domain-containing protein [Mycobacterium sp. AZCC_0083]MBB5166192.1 putative iron-regulated membrane protein [Mycobacterium sp. AZCC_0083]